MTRMKDSLRRAHDRGWTTARTAGGHIKLLHPDVATPVFTSSTPSDWRTGKNLDARLRRALSGPGEATDIDTTIDTGPDRVDVGVALNRPSHRPIKRLEPARFVMPRTPLPPTGDDDDKPRQPPVLIDHDAKRAWELCSMRLRRDGIEPSTLRALRKRFQIDHAYHNSVRRTYQVTPVEEIARLRADYRAGRIVPTAKSVAVEPRRLVPAVEATAVSVPPPPMADGAMLDTKAMIAQLSTDLQAERTRSGKALRDLADLRARSLRLEMASDEIEQQQEAIRVLTQDIEQSQTDLAETKQSHADQEASIERRLDRIENSLQSLFEFIGTVPGTMASVEAAMASIEAAVASVETVVATPQARLALSPSAQPRHTPGPAAASEPPHVRVERKPALYQSARPAVSLVPTQPARLIPAKPEKVTKPWPTMPRQSSLNAMGQRIRDARAVVGLSQMELGDRVRVSGTTVSFWERGKSPVRESYMHALARALNVTERFLRGGQ